MIISVYKKIKTCNLPILIEKLDDCELILRELLKKMKGDNGFDCSSVTETATHTHTLPKVETMVCVGGGGGWQGAEMPPRLNQHTDREKAGQICLKDMLSLFLFLSLILQLCTSLHFAQIQYIK